MLAPTDPTSPTTGHHMTLEEVNALVAPAPASITAVRDWLLGVEGVQEEHVRWTAAKDFCDRDLLWQLLIAPL